MPERRGRERIFEIEPVKRPKSPLLRRIIAKYVVWVEVFGFIFCAAVAAGIIWCWIYVVDEVAKEKDIGKSLIKPYEEAITHDKDAVVTMVAVKEWEHVTDWAPVVEVCDEPAWLARYKMIQHLSDFAKRMRELEKESALSASLAKQVAEAEKEVEIWNNTEAKKGRRVLLRAPREGDVTGTKDITGKFFKAGETICKIVDFNDLRIPIKLSGTNVERVRVGMKAKIRVSPDYGLGCVVRADAKLGWFRTERLQFNYVLDGKHIKEMLIAWWANHPVVSQEDFKRNVALVPTEIEEVETTCALLVQPMSTTQVEKLPESAFVEAEPLAPKNPIPGIVIQGKHTGTYTTNFISDEIQKELTQRIAAELKGKVAHRGDNSPALRIEDVRDVRNFLKIKAALTDLTMEEAKKTPIRPAEKPDAKKETPQEITAAVVDQKALGSIEWQFLRAGMDERFALAATMGVEVDKGDRFFEGTVRITNPYPLLSQKVKEAYQKTPQAFLKAKVEVVVGQCRLAMLLFRQ